MSTSGEMQETRSKEEKNVKPPAKVAHSLLLACLLLPLVCRRGIVSLLVVGTGTAALWAGSSRGARGIKPVEKLTRNDAVSMPAIGSGMLLALFVILKFLPPDLVNKVLRAYFSILGAVTMTGSLAPFFEESNWGNYWSSVAFRLHVPRIPRVMPEGMEVKPTKAGALFGALSGLLCSWYFSQKHWLANNLIGCAFSIQAIEQLSVSSTKVGLLLLGGLFVYDCFWVFGTPVMVTVAKGIEGPIKLLFPKKFPEEGEGLGKDDFSMLGLGDVVLPGLFACLALKFDKRTGSGTFLWTVLGYLMGLGLTVGSMHFFAAAQPALLYIVPTVISSAFAKASFEGKAKTFFLFDDDDSAKQKRSD